MHSLIAQTQRFIIIGVLATLSHYLVILLLVDIFKWLNPTAATLVGSMVGILTAYIGNYHFVFRVSDDRHAHYAPKFIATYAIVMAIHTGVMYLFVDLWQLRYEYGFVVATLFSATTTFLANRFIVFRT